MHHWWLDSKDEKFLEWEGAIPHSWFLLSLLLERKSGFTWHPLAFLSFVPFLFFPCCFYTIFTWNQTKKLQIMIYYYSWQLSLPHRVSCSYPSKNITIKIDENSNFPYYMAFVIWYQQGMKDITAVQLCEVSCTPFPCLNLVFIHLLKWNLTHLIFGNTGFSIQY